MGGREDRGGAGAFGLHPIPSVIDLPTNTGVSFEVERSGVDGVSRDLKMRVYGGGGAGNGVNGEVDEKIQNRNGYDKERVGKDGQISDIKRYDADGKGLSYYLYDTQTDNHIFFSVNQSHCICGYSFFSH
jgi:hypothetical protein